MAIWTGFGLVVPGIVLSMLLVVGACVDLVHGPDYFARHVWPTSFVLALSAPLVWLAGRWLREWPPRPEGADPGRHCLLLVPVDHWGPVLLAAAVLLVLV